MAIDPPTIAQQFMDLFRGFAGAQGTHGTPERDVDGMKMNIKRTARTIREPITIEHWEKHLAGERPLGVIPIREDNTCSWGSIDVDDYNINPLELIGHLKKNGIPLVPCRSKSGGLHLFLFTLEPQPAAAFQSVLREVAATLGLAGSEIFPKQVEVLLTRGDLGNWMVMPYFGSTYEGKIYEQVGLTENGGTMSAQQFLDRANQCKSHLGDLAYISKPRGKEHLDGPELFSDGPPCLQHMARGKFSKGGRNNVLLMIGIYLKRSDHLHWKSRLEQINQEKMNPPLDASEVVATQKALEKKEYNYTCKTEPMRSHCNSALCRTRRFGVGEPGAMPSISGISKLNIIPPLWFVNVDEHRVEVNTEQLYNYNLFNRACMEQCNRAYGAMKQSDWLIVLGVLLVDVTLIATPPEVGTRGNFLEILEDYLTNRLRGERREDLMSGRPWEDTEENRYCFRIKDLVKFVHREGLREMTRGHVAREITLLGGGSGYLNFKNQNGTNIFWVPSGAVRKTPPAELPEKPREII